MPSKIHKTWNLLIGVVIIILSWGFIYFKIFHRHNPEVMQTSLKSLLISGDFRQILWVVFGLMFLNWGLEALKWRFLVRRIEKVSFWKAFGGTLVGNAVGIFTPNRAGDFAGRVFVLDSKNRIEGAWMTLAGNAGQLLITFLAGSAGAIYMLYNFIDYPRFMPVYLVHGLILAVILLDGLLLACFLNVSLFTDFARRLIRPSWKRIWKSIRVFSAYTPREMLKVLVISLCRYLVFTFQFWLLLQAAGVQLPLHHAFPVLSVIYLTVAMVPTLALSELGVRGSVSVLVLDLYLAAHHLPAEILNPGIILASTVLWIINLAVPAAAGSVYGLTLKYFQK